MALQQAMQKLKLQMGEPHWLVKPNGFKALWHQGQGAVAEDFVVFAGQRCPLAAPQQGLDPNHEFVEVEGLGQVIISP